MLIFVATRSAHRQKWQRNRLKQEQEKNLSFQPGKCADVGNAGGSMDICALLIFVEFVLGN